MSPYAQIDALRAELFQYYLNDPAFFCMHALGNLTWSKSREIMESIRDNKYTAVRACHGAAKTHTGAQAALWFYSVFDDSKVITTAPTYNQVEKLLWSEIGAGFSKAKLDLPGECLNVNIKDTVDHFATGFSTDKPANAEGWHAPHVLYIVDEAKGVPTWLYNSADGSMSGPGARFLCISTTDGAGPGDYFYEIFKGKTGKFYNKIHISAYDLPTVTGEKMQGVRWLDDLGFKFEYYEKPIEELHIQLSDQDWINKCGALWGKDSALFLSKVMGELSVETEDGIVLLPDIIRMFENGKNPNFDDTGGKRVGVDVARFGGDSTVIIVGKGLKITEVIQLWKNDEKEVAAAVVQAIGGDKEYKIKIDDTGVGGGVTTILFHMGYSIYPVDFQAKAIDEDVYHNAIAEMWFTGAKKIPMVSYPHECDELKAQLVNRKKAKQDAKSRLVVEAKDVYKKRMKKLAGGNADAGLPGASPDLADALLLWLYDGTKLRTDGYKSVGKRKFTVKSRPAGF